MSSARKPTRGAATNGATPSGGMKRKASALQEIDHEPTKRATSVPKQSRPKSQSTSDTPQAGTGTEGTPFTVVCPAKPPKAKGRSADDVFRGRDDGGIQGLAIDYAVKPGGRWSGMRSYKNVKLSEQMFSTGSILYVNRHSPAPVPPDSDASPAELLKFDRENLWVGRVLECRADSERDVFLRIFWLYWPEELPMGRQSYHGEKELVMSNAMDIIDAQSIASAAEVSYWDERDEDGDSKLGERFWRQTVDVSKLGKLMKGGLSELRRHCTCEREYNPDNTMYKCVAEDCGIWNHQECLKENVLARTYQKSQDGGLHGNEGSAKIPVGRSKKDNAPVKEEPVKSSTKRFFPMEKMGELVSRGLSKVKDQMTPDRVGPERKEAEEKEGVLASLGKMPGFPWTIPPASERPWTGKFMAEVENEDADEGKEEVVARVWAVKKTAKKAVPFADQLVEEVCCLRCGTILK